MGGTEPVPPVDQDALVALGADGEFLRQILDISPTLIFAKDRGGRFILVNKTVADLYGAPIAELIGKTDADFNKNPEEVAFFRRVDLHVMDTLEEVVLEEEITDHTGRQHWLQTVKRPIIDPDGKANRMLGVSTDITRRRELEDQLRQSQKMDALGQMAGGVAHDFNNLLAIILGNTERLLISYEEGRTLDDRSLIGSLELKQSAGERAGSLISKLLAFSRRQPAKLAVVDLNSLVRGMEAMLRSLAGRRIQLSMDLDNEPLPVRADQGQFEQVLLNLVVNARDAMPEGGKLDIRTRAEKDLGKDRDADGAAGYVFLEVRDNGVGMPPEVIERIFEPFFTTKAKGKGTGLGLSTVYGIIRQCGGDVTVESRPGEGSLFRVRLPRSPVASGTEPHTRVTSDPKGGETILVCEDEKEVLELVRNTLTEQGYNVIAASDSREALDAARRIGGNLDLLLTDIIMPNMNGRQLAEKISQFVPQVRILYMTGYSSDLLGLDELPSTSWIGKPFRAADLLRRVRELLDQS
ncbi:MAG: PAS domain-containing protein [Phycisphaerae bacterium]|nr:PAS domain-containing protein [Phycisphaerae bacterium]